MATRPPAVVGSWPPLEVLGAGCRIPTPNLHLFIRNLPPTCTPLSPCSEVFQLCPGDPQGMGLLMATQHTSWPKTSGNMRLCISFRFILEMVIRSSGRPSCSLKLMATLNTKSLLAKLVFPYSPNGMRSRGWGRCFSCSGPPGRMNTHVITPAKCGYLNLTPNEQTHINS